MGWVGVVKLLLSFAIAVMRHVKEKQLIESAQAEVLLKQLEESNELLRNARAARDDALDDFDRHNGMPDDSDPNLRD
jgi:hypothetical protein